MTASDHSENRDAPDYFDLYKSIQDLPPGVRSAISGILARYCEMQSLKTIEREALRHTAIVASGLMPENATAVEFARLLSRPDILLHLRMGAFVARHVPPLKQDHKRA